ncbi:MAG: hypothetical protein NVS3B25_31990 [Hymenobacter sp.]
MYNLADDEWWRTAIIAVYGVGPAVCLVVGALVFWRFWVRGRASRGQVKLLQLWVAFHCCNAVFGALLADPLTQSGFWYVSDWLLRLGSAMNIFLALLAGLTQLALGYFGTVAFLQAHDSRTVMRFQNRRLMVMCTLVLPWVVGGAFIALTKIPYFSLHEALHLLVMGLLVLPMVLGCLNDPFSSTVHKAQSSHMAWGLVALSVLVALAWRLALSPPVLFS